jgi:hypothetical protein
MPSEKADWEDITPDSLINAVAHIRDRFEEEEFTFDFATQQACYKQLHPVEPTKTAAAVFKQYMDVYQEGLKDAAEKQFRDLLQIGLTNVQLLSQNPVEWAKSHLELLVTEKPYRVNLWIKNACDQQVLSKTTTPEDMEEFIHWRSWRAPRLIHMQPSGNTQYDAATAWSREDQERTEKLLRALSDRFIASLVFHLERLAGEAYVQLAKEGRQIQPPSTQRSSARGVERQRPDSNDPTPIAFIPYSWDSDRHKQWVLDLASRLQKQGGVRIVLDRWHLAPGGERTVFMEKSVASSTFVILICTPTYAERANKREGGVGYEAAIITGELAENINHGKFIPILRDGDWNSSLPAWIKTKLGVDMQGTPYSESAYQDLLRALHEEPLKPPPVGPRPILERNQSPVDSARISNATILTRIDTVTPIHSDVHQTIVICGQGFGSRPEEFPIGSDGVDTVGDSQKTSMAILNLGEGPHRWGAGRKTETNECAIGVRLRSWTDTRIVLAGFAGPIGTGVNDTYQISEGDRLKIVVFGPANRCGPGGLPECPDEVRRGRVAVFDTVVHPPIAQCDHTMH